MGPDCPLLLLLLACHGGHLQTSPPPNLLLLLADSWTPSIPRLSSLLPSSLLLTSYYSPTPSSARSSLLSGLLPHHAPSLTSSSLSCPSLLGHHLANLGYKVLRPSSALQAVLAIGAWQAEGGPPLLLYLDLAAAEARSLEGSVELLVSSLRAARLWNNSLLLLLPTAPEDSTRPVPALLASPLLPAGLPPSSPLLLHTADILATLLSAAGLPSPPPGDGVSQWAALLDPFLPGSRQELLLALDTKQKTGALRRGNLKLVVGPHTELVRAGAEPPGEATEDRPPADCFEEDIDFAGHGIMDNRVDKVGSALECQQHCGGREECSHWTWNSGAGSCWLKASDSGRRGREGKVSGPKACVLSTSLAVESSAAGHLSFQSQPDSEPEPCFEPDTDYKGHGLLDNQVSGVSSASACQTACRGREGCSHWTWNSGQQTCWLKQSSQGSRTKEGKVSGPRDCGGRNRGQEGVEAGVGVGTGAGAQSRIRRQAGCHEPGYNYAGQGLPDNKVAGLSSAGACQTQCQGRLGCTHWTWNIRAATCWLKLGKLGRKEDAGKVSGPRDCGLLEVEVGEEVNLEEDELFKEDKLLEDDKLLEEETVSGGDIFGGLEVRLYDLSVDPGEEMDLSRERGEDVEALLASLEEEAATAVELPGLDEGGCPKM